MNRQLIFWILIGTLAIGVGLYPLLYVLIEQKFGLLNLKPDSLLNDPVWNTGFYLHIFPGGLALLTGWTQFITRIRKRQVQWHRWLGKIYIVAVLISGTAGLYIAYYATGGIITQIGFAMLGILWLGTTLWAWKAILQRDFRQHQHMMLYSYALCFGAVLLRVWLPGLQMIGLDFVTSYRISAWAAWIPNLLIAYWWIPRWRVTGN